MQKVGVETENTGYPDIVGFTSYADFSVGFIIRFIAINIPLEDSYQGAINRALNTRELKTFIPSFKYYVQD